MQQRQDLPVDGIRDLVTSSASYAGGRIVGWRGWMPHSIRLAFDTKLAGPVETVLIAFRLKRHLPALPRNE